MNKNERVKLLKAINHLQANPCEWEDGMSLLYALAGLQYFDHRKATGPTLGLAEIMVTKKTNA